MRRNLRCWRSVTRHLVDLPAAGAHGVAIRLDGWRAVPSFRASVSSWIHEVMGVMSAPFDSLTPMSTGLRQVC